MKCFIVWLSNHTDHRDDEWLKVRANSKKDAKNISKGYYRDNRFSIQNVYTLPEMKEADPWIHALEWGRPCVND